MPTHLKQSLIITFDLLELDIPMAILLNAEDETVKTGIWIDSGELSRLPGVPVVESAAVKGLGTKDLKISLDKAGQGNLSLDYGKERLLSLPGFPVPGGQSSNWVSSLLLLVM